ncbi:hypothetical protein LX73_0390 [Fodinibius salinus]|uniref:Tetratricopeptide repeat-containing protein n=1 Tax=Fodinibius salinus TaxID=860790 RepID=A0A5D3YLQ0_9BACT|nr:tetratricopeptide repeat protein [Fodinibius salinus]TYP95095.1 hypothetical protein LX73_0390 [Fodinibius salinus]
MKTIKSLIACVLGIFVIGACSSQSTQKKIVDEAQIKKYLSEQQFTENSGLTDVQKNISFWKDQLSDDPGSMTNRGKLAAAYSSRFGITKDINDLHRADSLYNIVIEQAGGRTPGNLQALAQTAITKHDFKSALKYSQQALEIGDEKEASLLLLFDSMMETGDYELAKKNLHRLKNEHNFGYMIRKSKYKDYEGQLDSAITYMEKASKLVDHDNNVFAWSLSNLGDMYGHAGNVQKSYNTYLEVLKAENSRASYLHVLKGIAWIAYAHDRNLDFAREVLRFVKEQSMSPDVHLTLAEIAEFNGNQEKKTMHLQTFTEEAQKAAYLGMYNSYLIDLAITESEDFDRAQKLISKELNNRSTPQIYDLKAWMHFHQGNHQKALKIVQERVEGQAHEPVPAYHMAKIYQANGMKDKARKNYEQLLEGSFELGPVTTNDINQQLSKL